MRIACRVINIGQADVSEIHSWMADNGAAFPPWLPEHAADAPRIVHVKSQGAVPAVVASDTSVVWLVVGSPTLPPECRHERVVPFPSPISTSVLSEPTLRDVTWRLPSHSSSLLSPTDPAYSAPTTAPSIAEYLTHRFPTVVGAATDVASSLRQPRRQRRRRKPAQPTPPSAFAGAASLLAQLGTMDTAGVDWDDPTTPDDTGRLKTVFDAARLAATVATQIVDACGPDTLVALTRRALSVFGVAVPPPRQTPSVVSARVPKEAAARSGDGTQPRRRRPRRQPRRPTHLPSSSA